MKWGNLASCSTHPLHTANLLVPGQQALNSVQAPLAYENNIEIAFSAGFPHLPSRSSLPKLTNTNGKIHRRIGTLVQTKYGGEIHNKKTDSKA